jgi:hypothetical protein
MKIHNKLLLASELLVESAKTYRTASSDVDFAKSILIAGAVTGIIGPLLKESGTDPAQTQLAKLAAEIDGSKLADLAEREQLLEIGKFLRLSKFAYNTLKHAGGKKDIKAVDDLIFEANLKEEAFWVIDYAITDFRQIFIPQSVINAQLSADFLQLVQSPWVE